MVRDQEIKMDREKEEETCAYHGLKSRPDGMVRDQQI